MSFQFRNNISLAWKRLKAGEYTVKRFEANKRWEFTTDTSVNLLNGPSYYQNYDIKLYRAFYPENHKYFGNVANISSSLYERVFTTQSIDPKLLWYYLEHNYYTEYQKEKVPGLLTPDDTITYLWQSSSMMVLPMNMFGEGIRKNSFEITHLSPTSSYSYTMKDDGQGNLIDTDFDQTKFIGDSYLMMYLGFNEKYREYNYKNNKLNYVMDMSPYKNLVDIKRHKKITYQSGIPTSDTSQSSGVSAAFDGSSLSVRDGNIFNFNKSKNFSFSFWINVPPAQSFVSSSDNSLFNKNTVEDVYYKSSDSVLELGNIVEVVRRKEQYPFDISITNQNSATYGQVVFKQSSGIETVELKSTPLTPSTWHHVVCQKTGSNYEIWIDGGLDVSQNKLILRNVMNENKFFIADDGTGTNCFSGSLDEIRIYNKALTSNEINYLGDNSLKTGYAYQTARIGNVFYKTGMIVVSDPRPKYANSLLGRTGSFDHNELTDGFYGKFRGTTTMYEHELICKIRKHEFNFTQNPSVLKDSDVGSYMLENFVTSSFFNPYITTIGFYNDERELLAVAKLANPLEKRDDVDMNVIVRFDM